MVSLTQRFIIIDVIKYKFYFMKKIFILAICITTGFFSQAATTPTDSVQLKEKMEQVEKLVKQLQTEIRTLKTTDSTLTAELSSLRQSLPMKKERKLVIDRRGSKQAYFQ